MPALKAIAAAYARANEEEEENLEILIPLDVEPLMIPLQLTNTAPPVKQNKKTFWQM